MDLPSPKRSHTLLNAPCSDRQGMKTLWHWNSGGQADVEYLGKHHQAQNPAHSSMTRIQRHCACAAMAPGRANKVLACQATATMVALLPRCAIVNSALDTSLIVRFCHWDYLEHTTCAINKTINNTTTRTSTHSVLLLVSVRTFVVHRSTQYCLTSTPTARPCLPTCSQQHHHHWTLLRLS